MGFDEFEGFLFVGVKFMCRTTDRETTDQILGRICVQEDRTWEGTDLMQDA